MSNEQTRVNYSGGCSLELLTIAFIVLKLTHVIEWSWWWVLAPTWIPLALFLIVVIVMAIYVAIWE